MDNFYCDVTVGLDQRLKSVSLTQAINKVPWKKYEFCQILEVEKAEKNHKYLQIFQNS